MTESKDAYQKKAEAETNELEAKIILLKSKAEKASAEAQIIYDRQIDKLREQLSEVKKSMSELRKSTGDAWEDLRTGWQLKEFVGCIYRSVMGLHRVVVLLT